MALGLGAYDAAVIVADPAMATAFEAISAAGAAPAKEVSNFVTGPHARAVKAGGLNATGTAGASSPAGIAALLAAIVSGRVSRPTGRDLLDRHLADGTPADELLDSAGPGPISDDALLLAHIDAVIAANPGAVGDYRAGRPVTGFFVGQVMKATGGAADAARVTTLVRERLDEGGVTGWACPGWCCCSQESSSSSLGTLRARDPYRRYMALREQDANVARYEAWRGGVRNDSKTGSSVAMQVLRRKAQIGGLIVIAGVVCVVAAFVIR